MNSVRLERRHLGRRGADSAGMCASVASDDGWPVIACAPPRVLCHGLLCHGPTANGFPRLPVRNTDCLVHLATTPNEEDSLEDVAAAGVALRTALGVDTERLGLGEAHVEIRRLVPTARSTLGRSDLT